MTVFKYFFKVMKEYKGMLFLYTAILIGVSVFSLQTSENSTTFIESKPNILIIDNDNSKISNNLETYLEKHTNIKEIENNESKISDALFYRDVSFIIVIPDGYGESVISGNNKDIEIRSTEDVTAEYANMLLERYLRVSKFFEGESINEDILISNINKNIESDLDIEILSKLDTNSLGKASFYYNFTNYSLLAGCVFVISTVLNSFKSKNIQKRISISSFNYKKYNKELFMAGTIFGIVLWILYVLISLLIVKDVMFTNHGLLYLFNSFIFMLCAISIAFLIGNLLNNKEAINGIVNVVALGSSFLCGAFVPMQFLPEGVLMLAHFLPSYWFIKNNEMIKEIEVVNIESIMPIIENVIVIVIFTVIISLITNIVSKNKRKTS